VRERLELKADLVGCLAIAITVMLLGLLLGWSVCAIVTSVLCLSLGNLLAAPLARASRRRREPRRPL
jgi:hypothetical protein